MRLLSLWSLTTAARTTTHHRQPATMIHAPAPRADAACDAQMPLVDYVHELKTAKAALRAGLPAEQGAVSDDARALLRGLAALNPTAPTPAADGDLWSGTFDLLSASDALKALVGGRAAQASARLECDGPRADEPPPHCLASRAALELHVEGRDAVWLRFGLEVAAVGDAQLALRCSTLSLEAAEGDLPAMRAALTAILGAPAAADVWEGAPLYSAVARILFLDQDLLVVEACEESEVVDKPSELHVLSRV